MLEAIQKKVKRLSNRETISAAIVNQDLIDQYAENQKKYLALEEEFCKKSVKNLSIIPPIYEYSL